MGPIPSVMLSRRAKIALSVAAIVIVLLILVVKFSGVYINYLWFGEVGHRNVYSTILWTKVILFFIFGALMALIIGANLVVAYVTRPPFRPMSPEQQSLQHYVTMVEPRRRLVLGVVALIAFLSAGASAQGKWTLWQLWLHGGSFGVTDPLFHRDISFYAWDYPIYRTLLGFGFTAIIFSIILTVGVHYVTGAIRLQTPGPKITMAARRQLTIQIFFFIALKAIAYWLDRYGLVFSQRSKFTGASYTDVHSALPARTILFWIAVVLAVGVIASLWMRSSVLPGIGFVTLIVFSILIGGIYPAIVQSVSVNPNASDKEAPYIKDNITATRAAYGIQTYSSKNNTGSVSYAAYPALSNPSTTALTDANTTVDNIRILDPNVIGPTFTNAQKIALPYGFSDTLNIDRYKTPQNVLHDYVVGARELEPGNLTGSLNNWINQYTVYTHGYGYVAAQADQDVTNGQPSDYAEGNIPPKGALGLNISQPRIYFGQGMNDYAVVGAKGQRREYDGNEGKTTYTGKGGISLSSPLAKLAFAIKYKETNFLLNDAVSSPGARAIINRDPSERVKKVAPFLTIDGSPYPFVNKSTGHIMWMVDAYTTMANYPYSERQSLSDLTGTSVSQDQQDTQINYIRNSVKATVDAYDGTVKLYAWNSSDPVLKAWMNVFPGLVQSSKTMPYAVRSHVRYPQDLFNVQRALLAQYHISDPRDAYKGVGKWAVPTDPNGGRANQPAYYVLANPPSQGGSQAPQFQLTSPMIVNNSTNLAAYISADSDPGPDYGRMTVLQVPGKSTVFAPGQVANVFHTEPIIAKDITQLSGQSTVIKGNLLTLPLGNSFLYVEPLYVESDAATASTFPTLARVLVIYGNKKGYGANLQDALQDIQDNRQAGSSINVNETGTGTGVTTPPSSTASPSSTPTSGSSSSTTSAGSNTPLPGTVAGVLKQLDAANVELQGAQNLNQVSAALDRISSLTAQYNKLRAAQQSPGAGSSSAPSSPGG